MRSNNFSGQLGPYILDTALPAGSASHFLILMNSSLAILAAVLLVVGVG